MNQGPNSDHWCLNLRPNNSTCTNQLSLNRIQQFTILLSVPTPLPRDQGKCQSSSHCHQDQSRRKGVSCGWTSKAMPAVKREILKPQQSFWEPIDARRHETEICVGRFCYFLTWPWQYLLGYLCFLPKKCQMREEVCTPGEFNLTMLFGERKEREKGNCRKEQGQEIGTGEEEEE